MDRQAFKLRMQALKSYRESNPGKGYWDWRNNLPDNLKYTDDTEYDMVSAYNSGALPTLEEDGSYHLPTRVSNTGKILKSSIHPTYWRGLAEDEKLGYHTYWLPDGSTYNASKQDAPILAFADGGEVSREQQAILNALNAKGTPNQFMDTWNLARLATGNFNDLLGDGKLELQKANRDATAIYKSPGKYGFNSYLRGTPIVRSATMTELEAIQKHVLFAERFGYGTRTRMLNTNLKGLVGTLITAGEYNPRGRAIYAPTEDVLTHEQAHASKAYPQENRIQEILGGENKATTDYLDRPTEVYSRLMDFREINNIDPNQVWDKKALKELKKTGTDVDLLNRYKDDQLLDLFNTVADIGTERNYDQPLYLAEGGEVGDPDDEFIQAVNTKLGRTPDGRPKEQGLKPVFDLEDAANLTPVGDVITTKDIYNSVKESDWSNAGLAALTLLPFVPSGIRNIKAATRYVPSVNKGLDQRMLDNAFNSIKEKREYLSDVANERNRVLESVNGYAHRVRAQKADQMFGTNYNETYDLLSDLYEHHFFDLPEVLAKDMPQIGKMEAKASAKTRYNDTGVGAGPNDFDFLVNVDRTIDAKEIARHEMNHYTDYLISRNPNTTTNNNMLKQLESSLKNTDEKEYFRRGTEQKAYMNLLRARMYEDGAISSLDELVTPSMIKSYIDKLGDKDSIKRAYKQHKSLSSYTKWFNSIPLLGVGAIGVNKYFNNGTEQEK